MMTNQEQQGNEQGASESPAFDRWLRIDPEREALEGAQFLEELLRRVLIRPYYWKWATLALYNVTYAACILALRGTWPVFLLSTKQMEKSLCRQHELSFDRAVWQGPAASLRSLYERVQETKYMRRYTDSKPLPKDEEQSTSMAWLIRRRDQFTHFKAESFNHDLYLFPDHFLKVLEVITFLIEESETVDWYDDNQRLQFSQSIGRTRDLLCSIRTSLIPD